MRKLILSLLLILLTPTTSSLAESRYEEAPLSERALSLEKEYNQLKKMHGLNNELVMNTGIKLADYYKENYIFHKAEIFYSEIIPACTQFCSKNELIDVTVNHGIQLNILGRHREAQSSLEKALQYYMDRSGATDETTVKIMIQLGQLHSDSYNPSEAIPALDAAIHLLTKSDSGGDELLAWAKIHLAHAHLNNGNLTKSKLLLNESYSVLQRYSEQVSKRGAAFSLMVKAKVQITEGKLDAAETLLLSAISILTREYTANDPMTNEVMLLLGQIKGRLGKTSEAKNLLSEVTRIRKLTLGTKSTKYHEAVLAHAEFLLSINEVNPANTALTALITNMKDSRAEASYLFAKTNLVLSDVLSLLGKYEEAFSSLAIALKYFTENLKGSSPITTSIYFRLGKLFLRTANIQDAIKNFELVTRNQPKTAATNDIETADVFNYLGLCYHLLGNFIDADKAYRQSVSALHDFLKEYVPASSSTLSEQEKVFKNIYLNYLDFLLDAYRKKVNLPFSIENQILTVVEHLRNSKVKSVMLQFASRAASKSPELYELVRKEQDARKILSDQKTNLSQGISESGLNTAKVAYIGSQVGLIKEKTAEINKLQSQIENRFPSYSSLVNPSQLSIEEIKPSLSVNETVLNYFINESETLLWVIKKDNIHLQILDIGRKELDKEIYFLRRSLTSNARSFSDIPRFNTDRAYFLYTKLIKPVETLITKDLIIIPTGSLINLPFSALLKKPADFQEKTNTALFSEYRDLEWMIMQHDISISPSLASFFYIRKYVDIQYTQPKFIGIGNPKFNSSELTPGFNRAAVSISDQKKLPALPDTEDELRAIANTLGAENSKLLLNEKASESVLKDLDLSSYNIISFATHGLVTGELTNLDEPALALSTPPTRTDVDDGLLKMSEILSLKLYADWVILSACNTASSDGNLEAEGLTGLAQAFFYAGTKSLLVSIWPVVGVTTKQLIADTIKQRYLLKMKKSEALSIASRNIILGYVNNDENKSNISLAHPVFWAPFILVGGP